MARLIPLTFSIRGELGGPLHIGYSAGSADLSLMCMGPYLYPHIDVCLHMGGHLLYWHRDMSCAPWLFCRFCRAQDTSPMMTGRECRQISSIPSLEPLPLEYKEVYCHHFFDDKKSMISLLTFGGLGGSGPGGLHYQETI